MSEPLSAYVTITEAATMLDMKPRAVRLAAEQGRLPAIRFGEQWAILRRDVEAYRDKPRRSGRPRAPKDER